jgi:hypothetical protein
MLSPFARASKATKGEVSECLVVVITSLIVTRSFQSRSKAVALVVCYDLLDPLLPEALLPVLPDVFWPAPEDDESFWLFKTFLILSMVS